MMWQIFFGSVLLSTVHALIPNHWVPLVTLSKTEKWNKGETLLATVLTVISHTASTILIGVAVGIAGIRLSKSYGVITGTVAPSVLLAIGIIYIVADFRSNGHEHTHSNNGPEKSDRAKTRWTLIITLCITMFLTPCVEIEAYYFQAAQSGWSGIIIVSAVYFISTMLITLSLVIAGLKGLSRFRLHFMEHHEKLITGSVLVVLAILAYLIKF
jgi:nickel/cobalt transporter (NicO) family protein